MSVPSISNVDLKLLRVFMTVARSGGFSLAQTELNVSQATISIHIKNLALMNARTNAFQASPQLHKICPLPALQLRFLFRECDPYVALVKFAGNECLLVRAWEEERS